MRAQSATTLRFIPQIDLTFLDPHFTTANVTRVHGFMVFDTLFGEDGKGGTSHQMLAGHVVEEGDRLGELLVSIDLSILGAPDDRYDVYAKAVRAEYAHVPDDLWRTGRSSVLQRFLDARVIFPDPAFADWLEAQARANLSRELASLI